MRRQALQHLALAEAYAIHGSLPAALDQLQIARRQPDASFYEQSVIDARIREFQDRRRQGLDAEQQAALRVSVVRCRCARPAVVAPRNQNARGCRRGRCRRRSGRGRPP